MAQAWECIPSRPEVPITKRVEFCYSGWNPTMLLDFLPDAKSWGMYPRYVRLQVDSRDKMYSVNLYDADYRTWNVRCIWQGGILNAFGVFRGSIFCWIRDSNNWLLIDSTSGEIINQVPFTPALVRMVHGDYWLVRKPDESEGLWSVDRRTGEFVAHFRHVDFDDRSNAAISIKLSDDGKNLAWMQVPWPAADWWDRHESAKIGELTGRFLLQRDGAAEDIAVPIVIQANIGGSSWPTPRGTDLTINANRVVEFRALISDMVNRDNVWTIAIANGAVTSKTEPHKPSAPDDYATVGRVPVPAYLRREVKDFAGYGSGGIAAAFFRHVGIIKDKPGYDDNHAAVSRDGRHALYAAKRGPLLGDFMYGDLVTKKTIRWKAPDGLNPRDAMDFMWVETP